MLRVSVVAHPGARRVHVDLLDDNSLAVSVRARPVEGQANAAIEQAIASALQLKPRQVQIVNGQRSRRKIVELDLPDHGTLRKRLLAHAMRSS